MFGPANILVDIIKNCPMLQDGLFPCKKKGFSRDKVRISQELQQVSIGNIDNG